MIFQLDFISFLMVLTTRLAILRAYGAVLMLLSYILFFEILPYGEILYSPMTPVVYAEVGVLGLFLVLLSIILARF